MILTLAALVCLQGTIRCGVEYRPTVVPVDDRTYVGVDLRATNTPVRQALVNMGRQVQNERFDVAREVQGNVNGWFINLPYNLALARICGQVGAQSTTISEAKPDPKRPGVEPPNIRKVISLPAHPQKVNADFEGTDIRECLRALFRQADVSYTLDHLVQGQVTLKLDGEALNTALAKTLTQVRGAVVVEGGLFNVTSTTNPVTDAVLQRRVTFVADKERRLAALSRFARVAGITLEIEGNVNVNDRVTMKAEGQTVGEVLKGILGNRSSYAVKRGLLVVTPAQPG